MRRGFVLLRPAAKMRNRRDGFCRLRRPMIGERFGVDYHEHAVGEGANAEAVAYLELAAGKARLFGVGRHRNITAASLSAVVSGVNRLIKDRG